MKYRVEPFDCDTWNVVDPNGNVCCQRDDEEDAKTEAYALNRAYELGEAAALTARDAALERARVLANEVRAYRHPDSEHVDKTGHILTLRYSGDTIDELMKARASTDAANALGGEQ